MVTRSAARQGVGQHGGTAPSRAGRRGPRRRGRSDVGGPARPLRVLAAGLLTLLLAWLLAPAAPPLYDGVGFPDEPYRYVVAPSNVKVQTKPATAATVVVKVVGGTNPDAVYANSAEQGPQVSLFLPENGLSGPKTANRITLRASPRAPSGSLPAGTFNGNAYAVAAAAAGGPVSLTGDGRTLGAIRLRATLPSNPGPVFEYRTDAAWRQLPTTKVGNDIYQTPFTGFGEYALAFVAHPAGTVSSGGSGGLPVGLIVLTVLVVVVMVGAVLVVRVSRRGAG